MPYFVYIISCLYCFLFLSCNLQKKIKSKKNEKKSCPQENCLFPSRKLIRGYAPRKKCLPENPWKNKCTGKYTNLKNTVYIVVVLFAIVFGIFEGIRNVETLIARVAWLKNTSLPQYFNLKSGKRLDVLIILTTISFSKHSEDKTIRRRLAGSQ